MRPWLGCQLKIFMNDSTHVPIIALRGLEGNEQTRLQSLQELLFPYTDALVFAWATVFCATILSVVVWNIVLPLVKKD